MKKWIILLQKIFSLNFHSGFKNALARKIMFLPSPKDHGLSLPPTCNLLLWMSRCHISHLLYSYYSLKFKEVYFWEAVRTILLCLLQSLFGARLCWKRPQKTLILVFWNDLVSTHLIIEQFIPILEHTVYNPGLNNFDLLMVSEKC